MFTVSHSNPRLLSGSCDEYNNNNYYYYYYCYCYYYYYYYYYYYSDVAIWLKRLQQRLHLAEENQQGRSGSAPH